MVSVYVHAGVNGNVEGDANAVLQLLLPSYLLAPSKHLDPLNQTDRKVVEAAMGDDERDKVNEYFRSPYELQGFQNDEATGQSVWKSGPWQPFANR